MPSAEPNTDALIAAHMAESNSTDNLIKAHQVELEDKRLKNTPVESGLRGAAQGVTAGFADEAGGAIKAIPGAMAAYMNPQQSYSLSDLVKSYKSGRDEYRKNDALARQDNPLAFGTGEVAGTIGTAFIPGGQVAKGASFLQKAKGAAAMGAIQGAGTSQADLTEGNIEDLAKDTAEGALIGTTIQGAGSALGPVATGIADRTKNLAESRAVKAVTGQNISAFRQITGTTLKSAGAIQKAEDKITKVGRDILDEPGVLTPLSKVEDAAPKLAEAADKYGQLIGSVGHEIDKAIPNAVDGKSIANKLTDYAANIPETVGGKNLQEKILAEAANFEKKGSLGFEEAQLWKNQFKYNPVDADALISNKDATNAIRGIIGSEMDKTAQTIAKAAGNSAEDKALKDLVEQYGAFKEKYGSFKSASDAATDRVLKNQTNRFLSPSDQGLGAVAGLAQSGIHGAISPSTLAMGLGAAAANKFARERGSALAARSADTLSKMFQSQNTKEFMNAISPVMDAARKGNPTAIATFQILSNMNAPAVQFIENQQAMQRKAQ